MLLLGFTCTVTNALLDLSAEIWREYHGCADLSFVETTRSDSIRQNAKGIIVKQIQPMV